MQQSPDAARSIHRVGNFLVRKREEIYLIFAKTPWASFGRDLGRKCL